MCRPLTLTQAFITDEHQDDDPHRSLLLGTPGMFSDNVVLAFFKTKYLVPGRVARTAEDKERKQKAEAAGRSFHLPYAEVCLL